MATLYCSACLWNREWRQADTITASEALCYEHAIGGNEEADQHERRDVLEALAARRPAEE